MPQYFGIRVAATTLDAIQSLAHAADGQTPDGLIQNNNYNLKKTSRYR